MREDSMAMLADVAPDLAAALSRRALVLSRVAASQPVGRRALASSLSLSEREVRCEADMLREHGLITLDASGMRMTQKGMDALPAAQAISRGVLGLTALSQALQDALCIPHVTVTEDEESVGHAAARRLQKLLSPGMTIAVAGGRTMREMALSVQTARAMNVMVVPARGGVGSAVDTQASTVASLLSKALGGHFRPLHLPDSIEHGALMDMCHLPEVRETLELLQRADVIAAGVGRADVTAAQRALSKDAQQELLSRGAVGEALGDFFDGEGRVLHATSSFSRDLGVRKPGCVTLAAAAGESKARAILAMTKWRALDSLIVDESAAKAMLDLMRNA